jgi:ABC-2 type transport system ATP-binding protein
MEEASRCDRLLLMYDGEFIADSTPAELRQQCRTDDLDACFLYLIRARRAELGS